MEMVSFLMVDQAFLLLWININRWDKGDNCRERWMISPYSRHLSTASILHRLAECPQRKDVFRKMTHTVWVSLQNHNLDHRYIGYATTRDVLTGCFLDGINEVVLIIRWGVKTREGESWEFYPQKYSMGSFWVAEWWRVKISAAKYKDQWWWTNYK